MSVLPPDIKKDHFVKKEWFPYEKTLIDTINEYPIIYRPSVKVTDEYQHRANVNTIWNKIALMLNMRSETCKKVWIRIQLTYAKLKIMIDSGLVSKDHVISHVETSRFLDGSLSFLDPHISGITNEQIPASIHRHINSLRFGLVPLNIENVSNLGPNFITHKQVKNLLLKHESEQKYDSDSFDEQYVQNIVENAVKCKIAELLQKNNPLSIKNKKVIQKKNPVTVNQIPAQNVLNKDEEIKSNQNKLELETELIIENDIIKSESEDEDGVMEGNIGDIENTVVENDPIEHIVTNRGINKAVVDDTMNLLCENVDDKGIGDNVIDLTTIDSKEHTDVSDDYIRKFFNDLGKVMSVELSIEKQTILKTRINVLLKNIVEQE